MNAMSQRVLALALIGFGGITWLTSKPKTPTDSPTEPVAVASAPSGYRVSGPYSHDNLSIFLLHGPDTLETRRLKTLTEALHATDQEKDQTAIGTQHFIVHETGTVNTLMVENNSDDDVLILPGDIVKGGKQDRLIGAAVLVPAKSGKIAVPSFCVEQGRWTQRQGERVESFNANSQVIAGHGLKNAALVNGNQGEVWENVKGLQQQLAKAVKSEVSDQKSATSLQLTLENRLIKENLASYEAKLSQVLLGAKAAIGFVIVVNGEVSSAEVFGNSTVLAKAWPKMLQSAAVEALASKTNTAFPVATTEKIQAFLAEAEKGQVQMASHNSLPGPTPGGRGNQANFTPEFSLPPPVNLNAEDAIQPLSSRGRADRPTIQDATPQQAVPTLPAISSDNLSQPVQGRLSATRYHLMRQAGGNAQAAGFVAPAPVDVARRVSANCTVVESRDQAKPGTVIHRSFVAK